MYVEWPREPFVRRLEGKGHEMRLRLHLGPHDPLEPTSLIATYDNMLSCDLTAFDSCHAAELQVLRTSSEMWSAIAFRMNDGPWLIASNPWHAPTRVRASMMEEVAHIALKHKPTSVTPCPITGLLTRSYMKSKEKEAYGVAGAALVPYNGLFERLADCQSVNDIAQDYGVSTKLVEMRVNVTKVRASLAARLGR